MIIKDRNNIYLMIVLSVMLVFIIVLLAVNSVTTAPYKPEQMEQVEVIGKRKIPGHDEVGDPETKHLVTLNFLTVRKRNFGQVREERSITTPSMKVKQEPLHTKKGRT